MIDLHTHSTASDGILTPKELVKAASQAGIVALALTDHDTVDGIESALHAARAGGPRLYAGVELTVRFAGHGLHLLGYGIDHTEQALRDALRSLAARREERAQAMVGRLVEQGLAISWDRVRSQARGSVGRPHIGRALVGAGYAADLGDAFARYIGSGCRAYIPSASLPLPDLIKLVERAGGQVGLAHAFRGKHPPDIPAILPSLIANGLTGLEVYHNDHDPAAVSLLRGLVEHHGLWWSGGSDFHGPARAPGRLGAVSVPSSVLEQGPFLQSGPP